mmetsp:Transcript_107679/g.303316  ORF Transcript_107679/g.303316 Transcript_107679/m.303316 type:complete len:339 (+) Transcript_107679:625-1641(+)
MRYMARSVDCAPHRRCPHAARALSLRGRIAANMLWHPVAQPLRVGLARRCKPRVATDLVQRVIRGLAVAAEINGALPRMHVREVLHDAQAQEAAHVVRHYPVAVVDELHVAEFVLGAIVLDRDEYARVLLDLRLQRLDLGLGLRLGCGLAVRFFGPAVRGAADLPLHDKALHQGRVGNDHLDEHQLAWRLERREPPLHRPAALLRGAGPNSRVRLQLVRRVDDGDAASVDVPFHALLVLRVADDTIERHHYLSRCNFVSFFKECLEHGEKRIVVGEFYGREVEHPASGPMEEGKVAAQALREEWLSPSRQPDERDDVSLAYRPCEARRWRWDGCRLRV